MHIHTLFLLSLFLFFWHRITLEFLLTFLFAFLFPTESLMHANTHISHLLSLSLSHTLKFSHVLLLLSLLFNPIRNTLSLSFSHTQHTHSPSAPPPLPPRPSLQYRVYSHNSHVLTLKLSQVCNSHRTWWVSHSAARLCASDGKQYALQSARRGGNSERRELGG